MKKILVALLLLLSLLVTGCVKRPPGPTDTPPDGPTQETPREVENNGRYFVRVDDRVYFRRYGADALPRGVIGGAFTEDWSAGGTSELMAYDTKTGALTALYTETGSGKLWYGDGGFYLGECADSEPYVAWYALDGSRSTYLCPGTLLGVTDGGLLAVSRSEAADGEYRTVYAFYRAGAPVAEAETEESLTVAGLTDDGLFLLSTDFSGDDLAYGIRQITPEGELLSLGEVEPQEDESLYLVQPDRFLAAQDQVTVGLGYYAGTGHFLNFTVFVQAEIGKEGSLRTLTVDSAEEDAQPYPVADEAGGVSYAPALPGALRVAWDGEEALELWEDDAWQTLAPHFAPQRADGWATGDVVQHMDYVDGAAYAAVARACASPADDIGWREALSPVSLRYVRVARDGAVTQLDCTDCGAEVFGRVWFIEGANVALWQELTSEDGEGWFSAPNVYALPIADDAVWDANAFDGVTGLLPYDYGEGEADYFGYPAPEVEAAGELCLTLNADGVVVALTRRDPAALLNVDFDVPEDELVGAAATLPLTPRENDEDTPWVWAKLVALTDGVRLRLERTPDDVTNLEHAAMTNGAFVPGEVLYDGTLARGEFVAARVSFPWHPELRVSVSKDGDWGGYVFGEDNWQHMEDENGRHPGLTLAGYPSLGVSGSDGEGLRQALAGSWLYLSPEGRAAELSFDSEGGVWLSRGEALEVYTMHAALDRLYAEQWETPDLLRLRTEDAELTALLGYGPDVGDYAVELYRTEGEELLRLTQCNNGDGALGALLPGAEGSERYDLVFHRSRGAQDTGARRYGMTFEANVVRFDRDAGLCWLRAAERVESEPAVGDVWRAKPYAPCLAYPIAPEAAEELDRYPMLLCAVTTDRDGTIVALEEIP